MYEILLQKYNTSNNQITKTLYIMLSFFSCYRQRYRNCLHITSNNKILTDLYKSMLFSKSFYGDSWRFCLRRQYCNCIQAKPKDTVRNSFDQHNIILKVRHPYRSRRSDCDIGASTH